MRCPREDVATDSVTVGSGSLSTGAYVGTTCTLSRHPGGATGGHGGQKIKVGISAQFCLVLCLGDLRVPMHQYWELHHLLCHLTLLGHVGPMTSSVVPRGGREHRRFVGVTLYLPLQARIFSWSKHLGLFRYDLF